MNRERKKKVGLLGGSFNPAHDGHVYISGQAKEHLGLDEVWWLVSPQNPLKSEDVRGSFGRRVEQCEAITQSCDFIVVSTYEKDHDLQYTYDTVTSLQQDYPDTGFVWLMGADNMYQFDTWHRWQDIQQAVAIAILHRKSSNMGADNKAFLENEWQDIATLVEQAPPCWSYLKIEPHAASSTALRR